MAGEDEVKGLARTISSTHEPYLQGLVVSFDTYDWGAKTVHIFFDHVAGELKARGYRIRGVRCGWPTVIKAGGSAGDGAFEYVPSDGLPFRFSVVPEAFDRIELEVTRMRP